MEKEHIIYNFDTLATTQLRTEVLTILEAGYRAINTEEVLKSQVFIDCDILHVQNRTYDLSRYERIFFIGIGKCAARSGCFIEETLGDRLTDGIIIDVEGASLGKLTCIVGTHPTPSLKNVEAAQSVADMLKETTKDDLVLTVISGGGSALLCLPHDLQCEQIASITKSLIQVGATIDEINTVRKHTSKIQGGNFAKLAYPAQIISLIFSDVPGNDMSTIASGPTVMDITTRDDAERVLAKYNIKTICQLPNCELIETPKEPKYFTTVDNFLLLTNKTALTAMKEMAESFGYKTEIKSASLRGEARDVGVRLVHENTRLNTCFLYGGETTVRIKNNSGKGGRNQEVVLGALPEIKSNCVIIAAASDGYDNSEAAGAIGDMVLYNYSESCEIDWKKHLVENTSYDFFANVGGHIHTGKTGSNVADFFITLCK